MTLASQTSKLEIDVKHIPVPKKGWFNFFPGMNGKLRVKDSKGFVKDVVADQTLENFTITNTFGINNNTTFLESIEILTDELGNTNAAIPTDINQLTDVDGLLHEVIFINYADLVILKNAAGLEIGKKYAINDYVPAWNMFDGGTSTVIEDKVGIGEILIVTAASLSTLYKEAISVTHPTDTIYYSVDLVDDRDIGFGDGAGVPCAHFKGMIYYRKDTIQNVECHYDFRNVKFRRWAVDALEYEPGQYAYYTGQVSGMTTNITLTADTLGIIGSTISLLGDGVKTIVVLVSDWNIANPANTVSITAGDDTQIPDTGFYITLDDGVDTVAYIPKDVCKGSDGKIYKCITATTGEGDPTVNTADWILWLDITADAFVSWTSDKTQFNIGDITTDNLIINNVTTGVDFDDFETFGSFYNWVYNGKIISNSLEQNIQDWSYNTILNNYVIKTVDDYATLYDFEISGLNGTQTSGGQHFSIPVDCVNNVFSSISSSKFERFTSFNMVLITIQDCVFTNQLFSCLLHGGLFRKNIINYSLRYINFNLATHVYGDYNCTIYKDKTDGVRLSYLDNDVITYAAVTD
jgi:hypothetical protein